MSINRLTPVGARGLIQAYTELLIESTGSGTFNLDLRVSNAFRRVMTGNTTFAFINPPASGELQSFFLTTQQDATGGRTLTFPASVRWAGNTLPTIGTAANRIDIFSFTTIDGGATYSGSLSVPNVSP